MNRRILVVGATGILRPAVAPLVAQGWTVYALARSAPDLAVLADVVGVSSGAVVPVAVDYTDVAALRAALSDSSEPSGSSTSSGSIDTALIYAPAAGPNTLDQLRRAVSGPVVELLTSAVAAPTPQAAAGHQPFYIDTLAPPLPSPGEWWRVVLGWRTDSTWHSPAEISVAALQALAQRRNAVLGSVRPWADRPH